MGHLPIQSNIYLSHTLFRNVRLMHLMPIWKHRETLHVIASMLLKFSRYASTWLWKWALSRMPSRITLLC